MRSTGRPSPFTNLMWLIPGIGVKRWLGLLGIGVAILGLGAALALVSLNTAGVLPASWYTALTLQFLPPLARMALAVAVGTAAVALALHRLNQSVLSPFIQTGGIPLADAVYRLRQRDKGPQVVAIGGGTGLATLLRGLKRHTNNITAIITVADDGGSSGRLRRELGVPPPGDFRNCIAALADDESLVTQLFQYRFGLPSHEGAESGELSGHSFGNLFIAAMTGVTGSFERGLERSSQVLAIQGDILPSTLADVTLVGDVRKQPIDDPDPDVVRPGIHRVQGESRIPQVNGVIERVYLMPEGAPAYPAAVRAILTADLVVLGPGSLYTSVMPNLLVRGIQQALRTTEAPVVYVCNVANQPGETDNFTTDDFSRALKRHIGEDMIDVMVVNNRFLADHERGNTEFVELGTLDRMPLIADDLIDEQYPWRHDSDKLTQRLLPLARTHIKRAPSPDY